MPSKSDRPRFISENIRLAPFTSWQVGGVADFFCTPTKTEEIIEAQTWAQGKNFPITVLGGGSNVLVSDHGVRGLTICLKNFSGIKIEDTPTEIKLECFAGTSKSELLKIFLKFKLAPALFLAGIPGDVAGGIVMNAGVAESFTPREFVEITDWIEVLRPTGALEKISAKQLQWSYRHCVGWAPGIIARVGLRWPNQPDDSILDQVRNANKVRLSKQPLDKPSCGSVFVNPPGHKAAQLVDSCGLKGYTVGQAQVSLKHANFIVNLGDTTHGASATDIWQVIQHVQKTVLQQTQVQLKTEVIRLGEWTQLS